RSSPKARKRGVVAAVNHLKSQHAIEADRARHVVGGERDGADAFDHRPSSSERSARSLALGGNRPVRMTQIAALVAPSHVVDQGIRPLALHLEGAISASSAATVTLSCLPAMFMPTVIFEHHGGLFLATSVGRDARFGLLELREPHL